MFETQHRRFAAATRGVLRGLAVAGICVLAGCIYDVPITGSGTRSIEKFAYLKYALSPDGTTLTAYAVNADTIPKTVRTSAAARKLLRQNLAKPKLNGDEPLELVKQR